MAASSSPYSTVDTTSPFRSVKEAIATYGEQFLARKFASSDPEKADVVREDSMMLPPDHCETEIVEEGQRFDLHHRDGGGGGDDDYDEDDDANQSYDDDHGSKGFNGLTKMLKKLEDGLQETKFELKLLKEKEYETEIALASLNAELHKNLSKIARLEATEAANMNRHGSKSSILEREVSRELRCDGEGMGRDARNTAKDWPTLEQVLSIGYCEGYFMSSKKAAKKKPIVPLVTDIFAWKKKSPRAKVKEDLALLSPLYSSSMSLR